MTDLISLGIKVDATSAEAAAGSLDKLTVAGGRAETATQALGSTAVASSGGLGVLEAQATSATLATNALSLANARGARAAGFTAAETLNLSRQFADIGVTAAMGMNPLMILIQQGPQVAETFSSAAARGNTFSMMLGGVAKQLGLVVAVTPAAVTAQLAQANSANVAAQAQLKLAQANIAAAGGAQAAAAAAAAATVAQTAQGAAAAAAAGATTLALAPLAIALAAVAAVVAVFAGGLAVATREINKTGGSASDLQRRLGLTDAEMKKVGDTSISMGNVMQATFNVTAKALGEAFGPQIKAVQGFFSDLYKGVVSGGLAAIKGLLGAFIGGFYAIRDTWKLFPAAIGDAVISAANLAIGAANGMVAKGVEIINGLIDAANRAAGAVGLSIRIPTLSTPQIAELSNQYAGAMSRVGAAAGEGFGRGFTEASSLVDRAGAAIGAEASRLRDAAALARARPNGARPAAAAGASAGASDADREAAEAARDLARELERLADAEKRRAEAAASSIAAVRDNLALTQLEISLIGASTREREIAIAMMLAEREARAQNMSPAETALFIAASARLADAQLTLAAGQDAYNASLTETSDLLNQIDDQARDAASGMSEAFGQVGSALGNVLTLMTGYAAKQEELAVLRAEEVKAGRSAALIDRQSAAARIDYYGDLASAAKGFFKENSAGYKVAEAAEKAYRVYQFAVAAKSIVMKGMETAAHLLGVSTRVATVPVEVAADAATTASGTAAGAARIFAALGPWGFPVVGAMVGVMAALGASMLGGGGGSGPAINPQEMQDAAGTGSVLGDRSAKSESIARSLEIVASNSNRDLEFSNGMLRALRSIDDQIGTFAASIARSLGAGGALDTSGLRLGTTGSAPSLSNLGFSSSTNRTLLDQGVRFVSQSVGEIIAGGIAGATYQAVESTRRRTAFGITYSSSTRTETTSTALDADLRGQLTSIIASLRDGVLSAANVLGATGAEAVLNAFAVNLGQISFQNMSGAEIEEALKAIFSKLGDDMAVAALPVLAELQKVGEGAFETLIRVARQYQVVDMSLAAMGLTFGAVGVSSLAARERLVDLFGSIDNFAEQTAAYAETYLTEAERLAPVQSAVTAELARLGLTGLATRDQFKETVQGLDLTTAAGAEMFAALMALAPAFAKVTEESKALQTAKDVLSGAYDRESRALGDTIKRLSDLASGLRRYGASLATGPSAALSPEEQYRAAQAEFARVSGLAAGGDIGALGELQGVSQAYLTASRTYNASSRAYFDDLAAVTAAILEAEGAATAQVDVAQAQLDALTLSVSTLISIDETMVSVADAITALTALLAPPAGTAANDNRPLVSQLEQSNKTLTELVATQNASLQQQAAIAAAQEARFAAIEAQLARQTREMVA